IRISIVRNTVSQLSIKAVSLGLVLVANAIAPAPAEELPCPQAPPPASAAPPTPAPDGEKSNPADQPITIESDDKDFQFDVNGNARLCGNVDMRQGDRHIRADCLEYNAANESAKLTGGIEFATPELKVRGNNGTYSPTLGADFE